MKQVLIIISNSIKYNKKKIILKKCNRSIFISLYLLKFNIIKNLKKNETTLTLTLNFYKNKPILKNISFLKKHNKKEKSKIKVNF